MRCHISRLTALRFSGWLKMIQPIGPSFSSSSFSLIALSWSGNGSPSYRAPPLLVQPDLLHSPVVVERVVRDQVLHVRPLRETRLAPAHHRPRDVGLELSLDLPDELEPLAPVELLRLRIDQAVDPLVAVVSVIARRAALVVLEEVGVGVVDDAGGQ